MEAFNNFVESINGVIWADWVLYAVLAVGALFTLWSGICQYRNLTHGVAVTAGKYDDPDDPGAISHFQALSAALSATVGLGNIGGVAIAIAIGGPGAVFWMWIVGLAGMALKSTEVAQSMLFRDTSDPNNPHGGPMHVARKGFERWGLGPLGAFIGGLFCITLLISAVTGGNMFQAWNVGDITSEATAGEMPKYLVGFILAFIVGLVIIGGIKRIGSVASVLVPVMCVMYVITGLIVIIMNIGEIPGIFGSIFSSAFAPSEAGGAFVGGAFGTAFLWGMKRALFSSEAGQGSSPIAHSAAQTKEPISEATVAGLEPFIDTLVVCTLTALVMLSTGSLDRGGDGHGADAMFDPIPQVELIHVAEEDGKINPVWVFGEPHEYRHKDNLDTHTQPVTGDPWRNDDTFYVAGRTPLPDRIESAGNLDLGGGGWRHGTNVYVVADGGTEANKETASTRAQFTGTVVVPEEAAQSPYIRWSVIPVGSSSATQWAGLPEANARPHLVSGAIYKDYIGATFTAYAINRSLPGWGTWMIMIAAWLFAISTMISWSYYGEQGIVYLFGQWAVPLYKIIYCALIVVATTDIVETTKELGNLTDLGTGVMLWVNIPIMVIFGALAMKSWHGYFARVKSGEIRPTKGDSGSTAKGN
ncbi:MAG: amino acid carrier protein [Phycisphaerales bacterium]|nr:amino acid carrier protein [Phycisphaerales bacterium]